MFHPRRKCPMISYDGKRFEPRPIRQPETSGTKRSSSTVVAGANAGTSKLSDAKDKGVPVLDQAQFARLLAGDDVKDV